ncbi:MAG TPA: hypothetical protein VE984_06955 [Gaiellaceae bacterium]|nr:hypothetical protein [Gaiellaceae bacterium]
MSRKQRTQTLREEKEKRMKMVAVGGAVLLAVVLAFEVPKVMSGGKSATSTPPAVTTTATTGAPTTGAPATGTPAPATTAPGPAAASLSTASTKLPTSDVQPRRGKAQLFSFNHFTGKDPFVQQVSAAPATSSVAAGGGGGGSSKSSGSSGTSAKATAPAGNSSSRTLAVTGAARISVNGRVEVVRVGASFPSANPLFRLVGVSRGIARIGIANGSYSSGARTVALAAGRTLTLVDTADGIRYRLRLVSVA